MEVLHDLPYYYRQREGTDNLSPSLISDAVHTPLQVPARPTSSEDRYRELRQSYSAYRLPWGSEREYGGTMPILIPENYRPKSEPPRYLTKGHRHYGYGGDPWPRPSHLTEASSMFVRSSWTDWALATNTARVKYQPLPMGFPIAHPYQTHISRCALFPTFASPMDVCKGLDDVSLQQPFPATVPTGPYETTVLKKAKGNSYRHESVYFPSDSEKKALRWPGQELYYDIPKFDLKNTQIYYPKPPKLVAPNTTLTSLDPLYCKQEANIKRNLERSHWITSYTHDFSGMGPINPLEMDDYHEKEVATLTGEIEFDPPPQEKSHPEFIPPRPLEGRISRILQGRRPIESVIHNTEPAMPPIFTTCPECASSLPCRVHYLVPSQSEMTLVKGATPNGPVIPNRPASEAEEMIRYGLIPSLPHVPPPPCKTNEGLYNFYKIYEPNPYPKITDTYKNNALYWRQLAVRPTSEPCIPSPDAPYYDDLKPSRFDQCIVWHNPISLNKPSVLPNPEDQEPPYFPCYHLIHEPQIPDMGNKEEKNPLKWFPNVEIPLPVTRLKELQDSFSRSDAQRQLLESGVIQSPRTVGSDLEIVYGKGTFTAPGSHFARHHKRFLLNKV
ncbi:uncharacterized protein C7orf31 homolog [Gracilinanus agilis]|uniref:uncharacterized protein C7orf31 homolog n=1 Tax=Gracilinanus agilis TaxID=191870 RepID=UPI001CFF154B|nr:uncharacterized protein C7orf31 homolog [Gracilinanus agilis]